MQSLDAVMDAKYWRHDLKKCEGGKDIYMIAHSQIIDKKMGPIRESISSKFKSVNTALAGRINQPLRCELTSPIKQRSAA